MKYFLTHVLDESILEAGVEPAVPDRLATWVAEMDARGVLIDGDRLYPASDATTVRNRGEQPPVVDGPFAETKEQVAGYDLIEADSLDEAIAIAAAHPTTQVGAIEVRPVAPGMPTPELREPTPGKRRYLMLVCWDQTGDTEIPAAPDRAADAADAGTDTDADDPMGPWLEECGERRLHGWQLQPPSLATTVRRVDGRVVTTDGPFAETKEQIGGYDLLECDDLDEAIALAVSHGASVLELRPVLVA